MPSLIHSFKKQLHKNPSSAATSLIHALKKPLRRIQRRVLLELNQPANFGKMDLIHFVAKKLKLQNYLELCTPISGGKYWDIHRWRYNTVRILMYNCPDNLIADGVIDFRIPSFDIGPAVEKLKTDTNTIDICLVDGWHTYDCVLRDLNCMYQALADGGVLVVHDCLPVSELAASPDRVEGDWNGLTYKAYLDFVLARDDLDYCTVDVDYGCGIIFKKRTLSFLTDRSSELPAYWRSIRDDDKNLFFLFMKSHKELLRLVSAKTFIHGFRKTPYR